VTESLPMLRDRVAKIYVDNKLSLADAQDDFRLSLMREALRRTEGHVQNAASLLGVHRNTFAPLATARAAGKKGGQVMPLICANIECGKCTNALYVASVILRRAHPRKGEITNAIPIHVCFECYDKFESRSVRWNPYDDNVLDETTLLVVPRKFARQAVTTA